MVKMSWMTFDTIIFQESKGDFQHVRSRPISFLKGRTLDYSLNKVVQHHSALRRSVM